MLLALGMRLATRVAQRNVNHRDHQCARSPDAALCRGCRMLKAYPYVPLAGQIRIGIAIFSYDGQVNFGINR